MGKITLKDIQIIYDICYGLRLAKKNVSIVDNSICLKLKDVMEQTFSVTQRESDRIEVFNIRGSLDPVISFDFESLEQSLKILNGYKEILRYSTFGFHESQLCQQKKTAGISFSDFLSIYKILSLVLGVPEVLCLAPEGMEYAGYILKFKTFIVRLKTRQVSLAPFSLLNTVFPQLPFRDYPHKFIHLNLDETIERIITYESQR